MEYLHVAKKRIKDFLWKIVTFDTHTIIGW
jgi:hypothetical protein